MDEEAGSDEGASDAAAAATGAVVDVDDVEDADDSEDSDDDEVVQSPRIALICCTLLCEVRLADGLFATSEATRGALPEASAV